MSFQLQSTDGAVLHRILQLEVTISNSPPQSFCVVPYFFFIFSLSLPFLPYFPILSPHPPSRLPHFLYIYVTNYSSLRRSCLIAAADTCLTIFSWLMRLLHCKPAKTRSTIILNPESFINLNGPPLTVTNSMYASRTVSKSKPRNFAYLAASFIQNVILFSCNVNTSLFLFRNSVKSSLCKDRCFFQTARVFTF